MSAYSLRGLRWFEALAGDAKPLEGLPASLKVADVRLGEQTVRLLAVVADPDSRFPVLAMAKSVCWRAGVWLKRWMTPSTPTAMQSTSVR